MAQNSLLSADVLLRTYSHCLQVNNQI